LQSSTARWNPAPMEAASGHPQSDRVGRFGIKQSTDIAVNCFELAVPERPARASQTKADKTRLLHLMTVQIAAPGMRGLILLKRHSRQFVLISKPTSLTPPMTGGKIFLMDRAAIWTPAAASVNGAVFFSRSWNDKRSSSDTMPSSRCPWGGRRKHRSHSGHLWYEARRRLAARLGQGQN
jgi:hypothetical protein